MEIKGKEPLGLPEGSVRAIVFLLLGLNVLVLTSIVAVGCIWGPLTFENLEKFALIAVLTPFSGAMGYYFGQRGGKNKTAA